ncbi:hypothetical protein NP493_289g02010 [Ridgeia piscesae]|uniref:Thyroid transcription factor 1-associated protein 26 n=1 Tax=Ridgeia piscesae TaxID=27915 RepID=A0AAD9NWJ9_RIDPI|nr:hypothetical protein NP493_289g02010 [Ridgeia piscesae]
MKTKQFGRVKEFSNKRQKNDMKYRKFVGNKVEGQGFADRRKKKIVHEYKKILRKEGRNLEEWSEKMHKIYTDDDKTATPSVKNDSSKPKMSSLQKAEMEWKKKKHDKDQKRKELQQKQQERDAALTRYENKKREQHKKLSKKNYKGQPILAGRMDILLQQIEKLQKT